MSRATLMPAVLILIAAPLAAQRPSAEGFGPEVAEGLKRVRAATTPFRQVDAAVAAGYPREVPQCLSHPHHGAMGYHHLNRSLLDATIEVERPEILLYERRGGEYALTGVEYLVPYSAWSRDSVPPTVMGQPLKREDTLRLWYLHMWAWTDNPAGLFADWNPKVRCPSP